VDKDSVKLSCDSDKGKYRPGKITFQAREGRSINLGKIQEAITATRLSGHTNMRVDYLEITLLGKLVLRDREPVLKVSGSGEEFELAGDDRDVEKRLREAAGRGAERVSVTGRVDGWTGRFPVVLRTLAKRYGTDGKKPMLLVITSFEITAK
jgi:hypothetical protein